MMRDETMQHKLFHFHTAFGHPVNADYPYENVEEQVENAMVNMVDKNFDIESLIEYDEQVENTEAQQKAEDLLSLRKSLITEEYKEVMDAIDNKGPEEILKELCDLVYVCIGFATTYGWSFDVAFNRVHISNMSKLDANGKPILREDGKVLKSERYKEPTMEGLTGKLSEHFDWQ